MDYQPASKPTDQRFRDLEGDRFGRLTVTGYAGRQGAYKHHAWFVKCDCGVEKVANGPAMTSGKVISCGCEHAVTNRRLRQTHGEAHRTPEYAAWRSMKRRCLKQTDPKYPIYGGRGITVCARWLESYEAFLADMGRKPSPGHSLDRIDVDGNYEPGNCRWATAKVQANNRRARSGG